MSVMLRRIVVRTGEYNVEEDCDVKAEEDGALQQREVEVEAVTELPDVGQGRDRIEVEHDGNTEVLVKEMEVWGRLIWMREEVCENNGLQI